MRSERDFMLLTPPEPAEGGFILGCRIVLIVGGRNVERSMIEHVGSGLRVAKVMWAILCI